MLSRERIAEAFGLLGDRLAGFGADAGSRQVVERAAEANPWFMPGDIVRAVGAVCDRMLDREALAAWLSRYPQAEASKNVAVVAAGNVPFVGFFDVLCVLASGHRCLARFSSKDTVLMEYVCGLVSDIEPELAVAPYRDQAADAAIATGSDNTNRYFRARFAGIPALLRGNRASVAVLTGHETLEQLTGLADDIFAYSGLGCRNVSRLLVPRGYDIGALARTLDIYDPVNPRYRNNFRQRSAVLRMQGVEAVYGGFFVLHAHEGFAADVSEITYSSYHDPAQARRWLAANDPQIQCVVHDPAATGFDCPRQAVFGQAQRPSLTDYPDGRDIMEFLARV